MIETFSERCSRMHFVLDGYVQTRLKSKLEKLEKDFEKSKSEDGAAKHAEQIDELNSKHKLRTWLAEKAAQARQLKFATHIIKAIHPDAKGTVLYCSPGDLPSIDNVSSFHLPTASPDVIGNAAALDLVPLLALTCDGVTILDLMEQQDQDLMAVISDDPETARQIMMEFAKLKIADSQVSSHSLAKQLYWLHGIDAGNDADFELLAPLFASSLTHYVYEAIQADKFGDESKPQRDAKKAREYHDLPVFDYPDLLIQKIGGSNPQNISTLNSKRSGVNYLLPSLPPVWAQKDIYPPFNTTSVFDKWFKRKQMQLQVDSLRMFLKTNPPKNEDTRKTRDNYLYQIIDLIQDYANDLLALEPGWSADPACTLVREQKIWLDPDATELDADLLTVDGGEWRARVAEQFGRSINNLLREVLGKDDGLAMGDPEMKHWSEQFIKVLV